jgi:undecaprenyl-phosphate 4-deoxy-4-formamido-L-arabinose transferase
MNQILESAFPTSYKGRSGIELSYVIPLYRSEKTIAAVLWEIERMGSHDRREVVLVDDGSPDGTVVVVEQLIPLLKIPVTLVRHSRNYGEHSAVLTGLRHASGAWVVTMDDDMQNPPLEAVRLFEHCRLTGEDVVYSFYKSKKHESWRNLGSQFTNLVCDWVLDKPKGLYLSSFRCMNGFLAKTISQYLGPFPYIDGLILQATRRIGVLEVEHLERSVGESNYNMRRLLRLWMNMLTSFSIMPLRLATLIGFCVSGLGFAAACLVVVEWVLFHTPMGWGSVMAGLLAFSGIQLLILGVVGEYVGRTFLAVSAKPQSVVRSVVCYNP